MNFYIGNSIKKINKQDVNVDFSDELIDFIYQLSKKSSFDMRRLYEIDPYDDTVIPPNDLPEIIKICQYLLAESLLRGYAEPDEGRKMLQGLAGIAEKAISNNSGLVSVGD